MTTFTEAQAIRWRGVVAAIAAQGCVQVSHSDWRPSCLSMRADGHDWPLCPACLAQQALDEATP